MAALKTDHFFYKIFRRDPHLIFPLLGFEREDVYTFESITAKETEKRVDGYFLPSHGRGPNLFAEFQGYDDPAIYWRGMREVATWHESNTRIQRPFVLVVIFLDPAFDPGEPPFLFRPPCLLIRTTLQECLKRLRGDPGLLVVLEPLVLEDRSQLIERTRAWKEALERLNLSEKDSIFWIEQLEYAIVQRFPELTLEEVKHMLQITPLEETTAGKQIRALGHQEGKEEGREEGREEGKEEGILIGRILSYQKFLSKDETPLEALRAMTGEQLRALLSDLERSLP